MFKKIIISVILFFILPVFAISEAVASNISDASSAIKQKLTTFIAQNNIPAAAVQIYRDGKPEALYLGDAKSTTQFDIGSLSEIMTGLLLAQQVDAAKVQLSTPVMSRIAIPAKVAPADLTQITLRSLATNTSGLPANVMEGISPLHAVDSIWQPSSIGMTLLSKALEKVTRKNIAELYQQQIFSALGMRAVKVTATELKVSAGDMQKFLAAAIGLPGTPESVLYPMRLTQTAFVELNNRMIGLGWQIRSKEEEKQEALQTQIADDSVKEVPARPVFKADRQYDKAATSAYIAVLPDKKTGIVILLSAQVGEQELTQLGEQLLAGLMS